MLGINTSGRIVDLVAKSYISMCLGLKIKGSTENQSRKWKENFDSKLKPLQLFDMNSIETLLLDLP